MTITLPDETVRAAEQKATEFGYASVSDYLEAILRADAELDGILDAIYDQQVDNSPEAIAAERAEVIAALKQSEEDIAAGRCRPFKDVIRDIARANGIELDEVG